MFSLVNTDAFFTIAYEVTLQQPEPFYHGFIRKHAQILKDVLHKVIYLLSKSEEFFIFISPPYPWRSLGSFSLPVCT